MSEQKKVETKVTTAVPEAVALQLELTQVVCKIVSTLGLERAVKMLRSTLATFKV